MQKLIDVLSILTGLRKVSMLISARSARGGGLSDKRFGQYGID